MSDRMVGGALAGLRDWVLEPHPERAASRPPAAGSSSPSHPGIDAGGQSPLETFVAGLAGGCGTTTVARGLAAVLGRPAVVWDVGTTDPRSLPVAGHGNGSLVMVAAGASEPSLAELAAAMLARRSGRVLVAANRVREPERWVGRATVCLPESRIGAAIAIRGRRPPGRLGAALEDLASVLEAEPG